MLYDPKWEVKTKADPFTLGSLIAWLETRDPEEEYDYTKAYDCVLCRYFRAVGLDADYVVPGHVKIGNELQDLPQHFEKISHYSYKEWTCGGALKYARSLVQSK